MGSILRAAAVVSPAVGNLTCWRPLSDIILAPLGLPGSGRLALIFAEGEPEGSSRRGGAGTPVGTPHFSGNPSREVSCHGAPVIPVSHGWGSRGLALIAIGQGGNIRSFGSRRSPTPEPGGSSLPRPAGGPQ